MRHENECETMMLATAMLAPNDFHLAMIGMDSP
jgi:hypothetical protein